MPPGMRAFAVVAIVCGASVARAGTVEPPKPPAPGPPIEAELDGGIASGITPDPLLVASVAGHIPWRAWRFGAGIMFGRDATSRDMATATFSWLAARPSACWLVWSRVVEASACGHAEIGIVRASGSNIVDGRGVTRLWAASGLHVGARWPMRSRIFGQLELGASVPFVRDRYIFNPNTTIHETQVVTAWLGVGVGVRFR
jgi:hypothetical protein